MLPPGSRSLPISDQTIDLILYGYRHGWFMMGDQDNADQVTWQNPDPRGVFLIGGMRISRRLARRIRSDCYHATINRDFPGVISACASRPSTWISPAIQQIYLRLHESGHAHSIEVWESDSFAGGLYGVAIGAVFFGESMVSTRADGSKVALANLMHHLNATGFMLLDTQYPTPHLASLGGIAIPRQTYLDLLVPCIDRPGTDFLSRPLPQSGKAILGED
ncbi:MAG: leucyl/phenylalanyl-tRNA--protein transferase [Rhodobacteraceae bacterium]|nr:leucyl/phenylalanyl-tRNA--protein transferase [Paracoccaceae bacterium]